jgi:hypothetical protein
MEKMNQWQPKSFLFFSLCLSLVTACGGDDGRGSLVPPVPQPEAGVQDASMDAVVMDADPDGGMGVNDGAPDAFIGMDGGAFSCVLTDLVPYTLAVDTEMQSRIISVSADDDGFLVVWSAFDMADARRNIYARRVPLTGDLTESLRVTEDGWINDGPSTVGVGGGNALVSWYDNSECEDTPVDATCDYEIQVQQATRDGLVFGDRQTISTNTDLRDDNPTLIRNGDTTLLAWVRDDTFSRIAQTQILSSTGIPIGITREVTTDANSITNPVLTALGDGFAMAWAEPRMEARQMVVLPLTREGTPAGPIDVINTEDNADGYIDLAANELGGASVFGVQIDGIRDEVRFRPINLDGQAVGLERTLSRAPLRGRDPSIAPFHGGFIVAYRLLEGSPEGDGEFIRVVTTDVDGAIGDELDLADAQATGGRTSVSVAPDNTVLVVWPDYQEFVGTTISAVRIRCED